jgi:tRNA-dihydrouridine synthase
MAHDLYDRPAPIVPQGAEFAQMVQEHFTAMLSFYGRDLGARVARKHLGWYMDTAATPAPLRRDVLTQKDPEQVLSLLPQALETSTDQAAA